MSRTTVREQKPLSEAMVRKLDRMGLSYEQYQHIKDDAVDPIEALEMEFVR